MNNNIFDFDFVEKRKQEADRIRQKYPDRIPCIVEKAEKVSAREKKFNIVLMMNLFLYRAILLLLTRRNTCKLLLLLHILLSIVSLTFAM